MTSETSIRFNAELPAAAAGDVSSAVWYRNPDGSIRAGYWTASAGISIPLANHFTEFCSLLDGVVRLTAEGGKVDIYRGGEAFIIPAGYTGTWETLETCRKFFVIHDMPVPAERPVP